MYHTVIGSILFLNIVKLVPVYVVKVDRLVVDMILGVVVGEVVPILLPFLWDLCRHDHIG